jgi:uncharacterized membrane protein YccC
MAPRFQPREGLFAHFAATLRQMDWFRGLRAAVALCAPIVLGDIAGIPNLGWAGLGGFEAIVADSGGPYRSRLASLATLSVGGAAGLFIGSVTGTRLVWAIPVTLLFCFLWSYLAVLGQPFASAGILVQVLYICGLGAPAASWREALGHSLLLLAGGLWAALLSLFLWPLDAYRPARAAVSDCYMELASFLNSIAELAGRNRQRAVLWHRLARHHQFRVRSSVEKGWAAVAAIRASRQSDTAQGHQLVVLLEHADLLIARTVALAEHLEAQANIDSSTCQTITLDGFAELQSAERWIGSLLLRRRGQDVAAAQAMRQQMQQLPTALEDCICASITAGNETNDATRRFLLAQVTEAAAELDTAIESAALLRLGKAAADARPVHRTGGHSATHFAYVYERIHQFRQGWHPTRIVDQLVANFTGKSLLLRHAARVSLVCGLDTAIIFIFRIDHGYWLLLTSLIVLQPHVSGTMRRGMERIGGTIGGGILAAVLAALLHSQLAIAAALFPLALLALAFLPVNYTAFAFFLTPTFVLAWLPYSGDWQLALIRTANTIAGAVIALLAMLFLFPAYERDRAPEYLRTSIEADRRYLAQLSGAWRSHSRSSRPLANARRAAGLAHNDTEESLDRLLAESWPRRRPFAQFVAAFVTYLRRFAQSITALAALDGEWAWKQSGPVQRRLELLDRRLAWLEDRIGAGSSASSGGKAVFTTQFSPSPWPEPTVFELQAPPALDHPGERLMERLERQVEVLHRQLNTLLQKGWLPGYPADPMA